MLLEIEALLLLLERKMKHKMQALGGVKTSGKRKGNIYHPSIIKILYKTVYYNDVTADCIQIE